MRDDTLLREAMENGLPWTVGEKCVALTIASVALLCVLGIWKLAEIIV